MMILSLWDITYNPPSKNMQHNMAFFVKDSCNAKMLGIGSAKTVTSVNIFTTAYATQNLLESMHSAWIHLSHPPAIGTHCQMVAAMLPMLNVDMTPMRAQAEMMKPRLTNMRR
jgi:hypothetical protein